MQTKINARPMLALSLLLLAGCSRSLVITNATGETMQATRTVGPEEFEVTLEPGDRIAVPLGHGVNVNGVLIEVR